MYFRSLQILRGLAAVAIVLFHTRHYLPPGNGGTQTLFRWFTNEFSMGTAFFFVLSGFLMAYLIDTGYRNFLWRRLLRIYPTFLLAVMLASFARLLLFESVQAPGLYRALSLLPLNTQQKPLSYPLGVEWTLVYEVYFYLVCAVFAYRFMRRWFLPFLAAWTIIIIVANQYDAVTRNFLLDAQHNSFLLPSWQWISLAPQNILFACGGMAYHLFKCLPKTGWRASAVCTSLSVMVFTYGFHRGPHTLFGTVLMALSFIVLIIGVSGLEHPLEEARSRSRVIRFLEELGDRSYAIYLIHVPVISSFIASTQPWYQKQLIDPNLYGGIVLLLALSLGWYYGAVDLLLHGAFRRMSSGPGSKAREALLHGLKETEDEGRPSEAAGRAG